MYRLPVRRVKGGNKGVGTEETRENRQEKNGKRGKGTGT